MNSANYLALKHDYYMNISLSEQADLQIIFFFSTFAHWKSHVANLHYDVKINMAAKQTRPGAKVYKYTSIKKNNHMEESDG